MHRRLLPARVGRGFEVALADQPAFSYRRFGIGVSARCPMAVASPMVDRSTQGDSAGAALYGVLTPGAVAAAALAGSATGPFFIFPHPTVPDYWAIKSHAPRQVAGDAASVAAAIRRGPVNRDR